jgi:hypothetical protein
MTAPEVTKRLVAPNFLRRAAPRARGRPAMSREKPSTARTRRLSSRCAGLLIGAGVCFSATGVSAADAGHPAVVELFQSQGCSSCPPANANVNALSERGDVLALSFSVTYWDNLGWKDTFAKAQFTDR